MDKFATRLPQTCDAIIPGCQLRTARIISAGTPQAKTVVTTAESAAAPEKARLDALTALRFFAAGMVVVSHAAGVFHCLDKKWLIDMPLAQGVSFFFVLSGFILTYNYPQLGGVKEVLQFWRARVARIWPAHVFTLFLCLFIFALKPLTTWGLPITYNIAAHLAMVHGWILQDQFFFTVNPPSWSISTEFAFYLLFPFLIWKQEKTWWAKLLVAAGVVSAFMWFGAHQNLPELGNPTGLSVRGLMYINPLVRVFEFVLGMTCATLWQRVRHKKWNTAFLTTLEIGFIALITFYVGNVFHWLEPLHSSELGRIARCWLLYNGNCFAFAGLIFVCALQKGLIARALSNKFCVWLGEVSYSTYLLHMALIVLYAQNAAIFASIKPPLIFAGYCLVLITASHLTYTFIEKPLRKLLAGKRKAKVLTTGDLYRETGIAVAEQQRDTANIQKPQKLFAHIPFLDGLRALAIFWVLAFHSGGYFGEIVSKHSGWAGVDAFFVISGFLITGILLKEQSKTETVSLKNFYARRALRLMPAYALFIIITCLLNPMHCNHLLPAAGFAAIYMVDYDLALGWGNVLGSCMEVAWSLSVEEKFYLAWPTIIKYFRKSLVWIGVAAIVACFAWRAYLLQHGVFWMRISSSFECKIDALMIGCLAAVALHNDKSRAWLQKYCSNFVIPIALAAFVIYYLRGMGHPFGATTLKEKILYWDVRLPIFTFSFAALMMSLCLRPQSIVAKFFSLPPLVWLGKVSYSLYLWHMIAFVWVMNNAFNPGKSARWDVELLEYGLAVTFAAISYYLVEQPFLKIKDRYTVMADCSRQTTETSSASTPSSAQDPDFALTSAAAAAAHASNPRDPALAGATPSINGPKEL
jgi:peptidoglycan/LPS O-acetylase OafA/YrhL